MLSMVPVLLVYPFFEEQGFMKMQYLMLFLQSLPGLLMFVAGVVLWTKGERISRYFIRQGAGRETGLDEEPQNGRMEFSRDTLLFLQRMAITLIGLFIVVDSFPQLVEYLPKLYYLNWLGGSASDSFVTSALFPAIGIIVRFLLGVILIWASQGMTRFLNRRA